ncbi:MAG: iron ABC transporter permease [Deltaproteobacteria bacterium]|nr:iron ABC transporter permease [Deltaproteobacteria bacterium]
MATLIVLPFLGASTITPWDLLTSATDAIEREIVFSIRIPRVLVAMLCGAGLGLGGMSFQSMFRNPLATPFTLGVASGASLGAALYIQIGVVFAFAGISGVTLAAFAGALTSIAVVYGLTRLRQELSGNTMLLAGVALSFFFSSAIFFTQYLSDFTQSFRIMRWLMGGLEVHGFGTVLELFPIILGGLLVVLYLTHDLNALATGEEEAIGRGVNVARTRNLLFFSVSFMVAAVTATCGPIGFIGMMSPHICRLLIGANHRYLTPATALFGAIFLAWCDTLARTLIAPAEIPVGIFTALLGGPFFLWLLLSKNAGHRF